MLLTANGLTIKSTLDNTSTVQVDGSSYCCTFSNTITCLHLQYGDMVTELTDKAKYGLPTTYLNSNDSILSLSTEMRSIIRSIVRDLDPTNELTFLRVKSIKHEVRFWNSGPWCHFWRQTVFLKRRTKSFFQVMVAEALVWFWKQNVFLKRRTK